MLNHGLGQARLNGLETVLDIDLRHLRIGTGLERRGDTGAAQAALGFEIQQAVSTVELLLDQADHAFVQGLCRCAGVHGIDLNLWRGDHRVFGNRQLRNGQSPGQHDKQRNDPGKDRAVDKELRHAH